MLNDLLLLSGQDIPFEAAKTVIHQPLIKDIALLGEDIFYQGCEILRFSKENLTEEDKINLEQLSNFDIIMSMILNKDIQMQKARISFYFLMELLFPLYQIKVSKKAIELTKTSNDIEQKVIINNSNFDDFVKIVNAMFALKETSQEYNPDGSLAAKIADKLKRRHQKINQDKKQSKVSVLNRYISILAVGEQKNIADLMNYTVYQLFEEFQRYILKVNYDIFLKAKMAGAQNLEDVEDWMKDLHADSID